MHTHTENLADHPLIATGDVTPSQFNDHYIIVYRHVLHQLNKLGFAPDPIDTSHIHIPVENVACDMYLVFEANTLHLRSNADHRHPQLLEPLAMYLRYHACFVFHAFDIETKALRQSALYALPKPRQFWSAYLNQDLSQIHYRVSKEHFIKLVHHHEPSEFWVMVLANMDIARPQYMRT